MLLLLAACAWIDAGAWDDRLDPDGDGLPGTGAAGDEDCAPFDAALPTTYYGDADGDGHGGATTVSACEAPKGYAARGDDCDDTRADVSPSATERCDEGDEDEDCDGLRDDEDPSVDPATLGTWFVDHDGDDHAGGTDPARACEPPAGTSAEASDCDDDDPTVYPGAPEVCDDGRDNDCDEETVGDCRLDGPLDTQALDFGATAGEDGAVGYFVSTFPDLDGDGGEELILGTRNQPDYQARLYVVRGGGRGQVDLHATDLAEIVSAPSEYPQTGTLVADATALSGTPRLLIGTFANELESAQARIGRVYLASPAEFASGDLADLTPVFEGRDGDYTAHDVPAFGDVDADGYADLLLSARRHSAGSADHNGAVYLLRGDGTGTFAATLADDVDPLAVGDRGGDMLGAALGAADHDGDGYADVFLGAPGVDTLADGQVGPENGVLFVIAGPVDWGATYTNLPRTTDLQLYGGFGNDTLSDEEALDVGHDVDDDGHPDVFVGAVGNPGLDGSTGDPYTVSPGRAYLLPGGPRLVSGSVENAPYRFLGERDEDQFGHQVRVLGDVDGDGHLDLGVSSGVTDRADGVQAHAEDGDNAGRTWVFYGPLGKPGTYQVPEAADLVMTGADGERFGATLTAGDFDGDGRSDLLLGAPGAEDGGGGAWVLYGRGS